MCYKRLHTHTHTHTHTVILNLDFRKWRAEMKKKRDMAIMNSAACKIQKGAPCKDEIAISV